MSIYTDDYGLSGFSLDQFELVASRLLALSTRLFITDLHTWGQGQQYYHAKFNEGTDLRDAMSVLEFDMESASRLSCLIRVQVDGEHTNLTITVARRPGLTIVGGQLYLAQLTKLSSPRACLDGLIQELARVSMDLNTPLLGVGLEDSSPVIDGTEIRRPEVVAIFDPEWLPSLAPFSLRSEGRSIMWFVEPGAFLAGATSDPECINRFLEACREAKLSRLSRRSRDD